MQDSEWLPLAKGLYCNQEKGLSFLLSKRIKKIEEHALHDNPNNVDNRYIPLCNLVPLYEKNSQQL